MIIHKVTVFVAVLLFLTGCAKSYRQIIPERRAFTNYSDQDSVVFQYRYNILRESGNLRYSKKELKKGIHLVAVKIENHTTRPLEVGKDLNFYMNNSRLGTLDPVTVRRSLKQSPYVYLLYLLLLPVPTTNNGKRTRVQPPAWEYAVGPGLAALNMFVAAQSNKRFGEELAKYNITGKVIPPGGKIYGLVGFPYLGYDPLTIRIEN